MLIRDEIVHVRLHIVTDRCRCEEFDEVVEANEKDTVFSVFKANLLSSERRPFARLVTPVSFPFYSTVGIPDLY